MYNSSFNENQALTKAHQVVQADVVLGQVTFPTHCSISKGPGEQSSD